MEIPGQGEWFKARRGTDPDHHPDFDKSTSQERMHDPEAAKKYLEELREREKANPEEARDEIRKMITQLERLLGETTH